MSNCLTALAKKFQEVKFVKIRSTQAVENWPDSNLPTLFMYQNGALAKQMIGTRSLGGVSDRECFTVVPCHLLRA